MNIVVLVSGGIAETLQAVPLVRAVATARATPPLLVCPPHGAELVRTLAGVGEVCPVAALGAHSGRPGQVWSTLRFRRLDVALVCSERPGVRAAAYAAAVPRRLGCHGGLSDLLLTEAVACPPDENRELAWSRLAAPLGIAVSSSVPRYTPPAAVLAAAERHLLKSGVGDGRLLVAIAPGQGFGGAGGESWNPERYAHLANRLAARHGVGVVLIGDAGDRGVADILRLDLAAEVVDLCGELDLTTAAAVIARCDLLVSADTPLLHVAAAVGTPSVGLFAATDGRRRGAAGGEHRIVQAVTNGTTASLERIRVDDVLAAIEGAL